MGHGRSRTVLIGLGLGSGAALMYLLDPQGGKRRRALIRDRMVHWAKKTTAGAEATARDVRNRALGLAAEARSRVGPEPVSDAVLAERVRAEAGRVVSHPRSIDVDVEDGRVTLRGIALTGDARRLLRRVRRVPGVRHVDSRLETHETAGDRPGLQGGVPRRAWPDVWQAYWSPTTRVLAGTVGAALVALGAARRGALGLASAVAGAGLAGRAASNLELKRLLGFGGGRPATPPSQRDGAIGERSAEIAVRG
jgi:hypothetical protein